MTAKRSRNLALLIVVLTGAILGGGAWLIVEVGRAMTLIRDSEMRLYAMHHVCGLVGTYVEKSGYSKWPRSWEDLLTQAEDGGFVGGWSPSRPRLQDLVIIDFDADLKALQQQEVTEFTAVRPAPGGTARSVSMEIHGLLSRIRGPVEWQPPIPEGTK